MDGSHCLCDPCGRLWICLIVDIEGGSHQFSTEAWAPVGLVPG